MNQKRLRFRAVEPGRHDNIIIWDNQDNRPIALLYFQYRGLLQFMLKQLNREPVKVEESIQDPEGYASQYLTEW